MSYRFIKKNHPKSLGREWVKEEIRPIIKQKKLMITRDFMCTFCEHIAYQIAQSMPQKGKVLITGGGAYNDFLIERIEENARKGVEIVIPKRKSLSLKRGLSLGF